MRAYHGEQLTPAVVLDPKEEPDCQEVPFAAFLCLVLRTVAAPVGQIRLPHAVDSESHPPIVNIPVRRVREGSGQRFEAEDEAGEEDAVQFGKGREGLIVGQGCGGVRRKVVRQSGGERRIGVRVYAQVLRSVCGGVEGEDLDGGVEVIGADAGAGEQVVALAQVFDGAVDLHVLDREEADEVDGGVDAVGFGAPSGEDEELDELAAGGEDVVDDAALALLLLEVVVAGVWAVEGSGEGLDEGREVGVGGGDDAVDQVRERDEVLEDDGQLAEVWLVRSAVLQRRLLWSRVGVVGSSGTLSWPNRAPLGRRRRRRIHSSGRPP